jgi:GH24 family phage-related lysozyme (muramidase)
MNDYSIHPAVPLIKKFEGFKSQPYPDVNHLTASATAPTRSPGRMDRSLK